MAAEDLLHLKRRLVGVDDRECFVAGVVVGDEPSGLERHGHLPLEPQFFLDDQVGFGKCLGRIAAFEREIKRDIVAEFRVDSGRVRSGRLQCVAQRRQRLIFRKDKLGGVFGLRAAFGDDNRNRLALPDDAIGRQKKLRGGAMAGSVLRHGDKRSAFVIDVGGGEHRDHPGRFPGGRDVQRNQPGVRMRAAHEVSMHHAR